MICAYFDALCYLKWCYNRISINLKNVLSEKNHTKEYMHTVLFPLYEAQEQTKLICRDRSQNSGCLGVILTGRGHKEIFRGDKNVLDLSLRWLQGCQNMS